MTYDTHADDPLEAISSVKRKDRYAEYAKYQHLYEIDDHVKKMEESEVEAIILEVCSKDRENQLGRRFAHVNSRALVQQDQHKTSNEKANAFLEKESLYLQAAGVICHVCAVQYGAGFSAMGEAFSRSANYVDKGVESRRGMLDHNYQRTRDLVGDHGQQMQSADKGHEQSANMLDRVIQNSRRQAELVMGG